MNRKLTCAFGLLGLAAGALADDLNDFRGYIGVRAGTSFFVDSDMRDYFGKGRITFGITPVKVAGPSGWKVDTDLDVQVARDNGNRLLMIPFTVGIGRPFGDAKNGTRPYAAVRAGVAYVDYGITDKFNVRQEEKKVVPTANVEVGLIFSERMKLAARYDYFGRTNGLRFDGFQINLSVGLFKF